MCSICKQIPCNSHCPNYIPPNTYHYCSICNNGIYNGEEYVENYDDEYAHYDCLTNLSYRAMIEWLGEEIKTMENDYD